MRSKKRRNQAAAQIFRLLPLVPAAFLATVPLWQETSLQAQVITATLNGTVQDTSGAVVPGATVTLKNVQSNDSRQLTTNGAGYFTFASVPSGTYDLVVTARGFHRYLQTGVQLNPGDSRALNNIQLAVGTEAQTVTVSSTAAGIPLDNGELSSTISSSDLEHLSVEGRDATELFRILPGFAIANQGYGNSASDQSQVNPSGALGAYASNGAPIAGISLKLDGADLTDPGSYGAGLQNVNDDMVSEVQVQTSNFGAEEANGPIDITAVTKAGGKDFHGSIYTYARTYQLNANDWLNNYTGQAKPQDRYLYPGANVGGPLLIPGTHFNQNKKITFFVGAEDYAQRNVYAYDSAGSALVHALVPTAGMRAGDFSAAQLSQYLGPNYGSSTYANITSVPTVAKNGAPIVNGQIPTSMMDPGALALMNMLPLPNMPTTADGFNYQTENLVNNDLWQATARVDYAISEKNHLFGRYTIERGAQGQPQVPYYSPSAVMGSINTPGGLLFTTDVHSAALNLTTIFNATTTNELFGTFTYAAPEFKAANPSALSSATLGFPYKGAYNNGSTQVPQLLDYGYDGLPVAPIPDFSYGPLFLHKFNPNGGDNLTKVWGTHTVRFGVFVQRVTNNQTLTNGTTNGTVALYDFTPTLTDPSGNTYTTSGNYLANFMEGMLQNYGQQNILTDTNLYFWNVDEYAQDTWRMRKNLTLTYGMRLEHLGSWQDAHGFGAAVFEPSTMGETSLPLPGFEWHSIDSSIPNSGVGSTPLFFEPRVGFAWDLFGNGKTIFRGGYGSYRMHDSFDDVSAAFGNSQGLRSISEYGTGGVTFSSINSMNLPTNSGALNTTAAGLMPGDHTEPVTNNYSFSIAENLPHSSVVQVSYVGSNSHSLMNNGSDQTITLNNVNAIPINGLYKPDPVTGAPAPTPYTVDSLTTQQIDDYRPYPLYSTITVPQHNTTANYNALQAVFQHNSTHWLLDVNYTYSKALGILGSAADFNYSSPISPFNIGQNYGPLAFDRSQIFNASYSYTFGKYVQNRWAGLAVNHWMLSGITNLQSGANMQTGISASPSFYLQGGIGPTSSATHLNVDNKTFLGTPDVNLQPVLTCNPRSNLAHDQFVNASCFGLPNIGQNGQDIFPYMHGPAFFDSDLTAQKTFDMGGTKNLNFRVAAFNFLNHPLTSFNQSYPGQYTLDLSNANAGATAASVTPSAGFGYAPYKTGRRVMELSAKFSF